VTEGLKIQKKRRMHNCIANCNTWHNNHFFLSVPLQRQIYVLSDQRNTMKCKQHEKETLQTA